MKYKLCYRCSYITKTMYEVRCRECRHPLHIQELPDWIPEPEREQIISLVCDDIETELEQAKRSRSRPKSFTPLQWVEYENDTKEEL